MAGFTLSNGEDPPVEPLAPQLPVEADEGQPASLAPTTAVPPTQGAAPRRPRARSLSHAGGPFVLPRRDYSGDEDVDMVDVSGEANDGSAERKEEAPPSKRVQTMTTLPTPPVFRGSTAQDKQMFMKKYEAYCRQLSALETSFFRPFRMPVGACVEDERRRLIALFDICKPLDDITEEDWIDYFWEGRIAGGLDFDKEKALMSTKLNMDVQLADADSRVSKLAHEMYQLLEKENMEWMVEREPKKIVSYLSDALAPDQFRRTVKNELARESNKPLTKNVVAFIKWLRTSCKEYVRWEPRASPKAPSTGKPPAKKPIPPPTKAAPTKTPPTARRKRTCLKCGSEEYRVKDCPRAGAGEAEQLLREWREKRAPPAAAPAEPVHHVKALQLQEVPLQAGSGCLARLENVLDLDNVLLDSGTDVNVASRHFEVTKRVRFGAIQVQTTAGPLLLRNTPAWVFEHEKEKHTLVLSRPVMERLGYSVDAILAQACDTSREWDMQDISGSDGGAIHLIREPSFQHAPPRATEINDAELRAATPDIGIAGDNAQAQVAAILADRVVEAADAGLAPEEVERLRTILQDYQDVCRVEFGRDPPVRVESLRIRLREGATPVRSNTRRYPPAHMAYLDQHVQELLDNGLAFINPSSRWASPPRIVSKSDPGTYRMTVDMRAVNVRTEPILWPMPILEAALGLLEGWTCYFTLDWFRGYWQLSLDPASQEMFSIMTHRGIITPTRVSMGGIDSVAYCQHVVEEVFRPVLYKGVLAWLDDILGYAADRVNLLEVLERVLAACH
ncbi:DEAD-box ATP-dependent RNA helicase 36 [Phytophthora cinnamomi]|uniref:DEAD-box ATP-dependent RNA helicase 36 n=1 Tax=Phytophthora cinnamomi TaxID=4785 RepID=UPI003559598C|nr:DEAD-box ATP-dependent RNA helicase 36 [Phytophthora cinnamomi]